MGKHYGRLGLAHLGEKKTMGRQMLLCSARAINKYGPYIQFFYQKQKGKLYNENKNKIVHRHIIYQNFQKKISYSMGIFLALNKIHKNSNKSKSATALLKSNKNHFQNTKINSNLFLSNFLLQGIMLPYFPYIFILEKNNLNKTQILQIENNFQKDFKLDPFKLPTHISYVLKKSFYLLS